MHVTHGCLCAMVQCSPSSSIYITQLCAAGAFLGSGESAVANNIINHTHRIQAWDFSHCNIPDISNSECYTTQHYIPCTHGVPLKPGWQENQLSILNM